MSAVVKGRKQVIDANNPPADGKRPLLIFCVPPKYPITLTRSLLTNKSRIKVVLTVESALALMP